MKQFLKYFLPLFSLCLLLIFFSCSTEDVKPIPPSIGTFSVPSKRIGSAPFELTTPSSNSAGTFTYTSADTSIATVSGSTVTVVGIGSTTITATQAANAGYDSGTITATSGLIGGFTITCF